MKGYGPRSIYSASGLVSSRFADSLAVGFSIAAINVPNVNNTDWVVIPVNLAGLVTTYYFYNMFFGQALSNGGGNGLAASLQGPNPANWALSMAIVPGRFLPASNAQTPFYYKAKRKFIQFQINKQVTANAGVGIMNFEDASGNGAGAMGGTIQRDAYMIDGGGTLQRFNSGGAAVTLQAGSAVVQGDVWRMAMDASNPNQTVLTVSKNGIVQYTNTDANAKRLTGNGLPFIAVVGVAAGGTFEIKNFLCDLGA